jgi:hypothetical protein
MRLFKTALLFCLFALCGCVAVIESNEMLKRTQTLLNADFQGTTIKDLEYVEGEYHHYDLYLPVDKNNTRSQKLILFVHGGGWTSGSKEDGENWCRYFAHQGYTTAALDYSLQTQGQTPDVGPSRMVERHHRRALRLRLAQLLPDGVPQTDGTDPLVVSGKCPCGNYSFCVMEL